MDHEKFAELLDMIEDWQEKGGTPGALAEDVVRFFRGLQSLEANPRLSVVTHYPIDDVHRVDTVAWPRSIL